MLADREQNAVCTNDPIIKHKASLSHKEFLQILRKDDQIPLPDKPVTRENFADTTVTERYFLETWVMNAVLMEENQQTSQGMRQDFLTRMVVDEGVLLAIESMERRIKEKGLSSMAYWYALVLSQMANVSYTIRGNIPEEMRDKYMRVARAATIFLHSFSAAFFDQYKTKIQLPEFRTTFSQGHITLSEELVAAIYASEVSKDRSPISTDDDVFVVPEPFTIDTTDSAGERGLFYEYESVSGSWKHVYTTMARIVEMMYPQGGAQLVKDYIYSLLGAMKHQKHTTFSLEEFGIILKLADQKLQREIKNYQRLSKEDGEKRMNVTIMKLWDGNIVITGFAKDDPSRLEMLIYIETKKNRNVHIGKDRIRIWVQPQNFVFHKFKKNDFGINIPPANKDGRINREFIQKTLRLKAANDFADAQQLGYIQQVFPL